MEITGEIGEGKSAEEDIELLYEWVRAQKERKDPLGGIWDVAKGGTARMFRCPLCESIYELGDGEEHVGIRIEIQVGSKGGGKRKCICKGCRDQISAGLNLPSLEVMLESSEKKAEERLDRLEQKVEEFIKNVEAGCLLSRTKRYIGRDK